MRVELIRHMKIDNSGIFGELFLGDERFCLTKERLWVYNEKFISCIPDDKYPCIIISHSKWGSCILMQAVKNRSEILFHWGSYLRDLKGCITTGTIIEQIKPDSELILKNSKKTHKNLMKFFERNNIKEFTLEISSPWELTV